MALVRVLDAPVPIVAVVLQAVPGVPEGAPGWLTAMLFGVWLVLWVLDRTGRLPSKGGAALAGFRDEDRLRLKHVHELLAKEDDDGVPRFLRHVIETHHAVERQKLFIETNARLTKMIDDHYQLVGVVADQLRVTNQRLGALEHEEKTA